jgi:hypothetical protein
MSTSDLDDPTFTGELNLGGDPAETEVETEELPPLTDYGQRFIETVPEEERVYADKWVRQWDAGVAKLRQKHEADIATYTQLGPVDDVRAGVQLYRMLTGTPDQKQEIADWLADNGITPKQLADAVQAHQKQQIEAGELDPYEERFKKLESVVVMTAEQQRQALEAQQIKAQQDEYVRLLNDAEARLGKFDRQYVSYLLSKGQANTLDEAVQAYHRLVPGQRKQAPRLLGSSGSAPHTAGGKKLDFGSMSEKDVGKFLVARLEAERAIDNGG